MPPFLKLSDSQLLVLYFISWQDFMSHDVLDHGQEQFESRLSHYFEIQKTQEILKWIFYNFSIELFIKYGAMHEGYKYGLVGNAIITEANEFTQICIDMGVVQQLEIHREIFDSFAMSIFDQFYSISIKPYEDYHTRYSNY